MNIPTNAKIYIAGHLGLVGSAILRKYQQEGYANLLYKTKKELDLTNQAQVELFFQKEAPEYVILAAARVGGIKANMTYPAEFIYENTMIQNNIIWSSMKYNVKKLLYLSCGCAYPTAAEQPLKEASLLTGIPEPTNEGFAIAKLEGMKLCEKISKQYHRNFISCIPANTYGPNDHFEEERSHVIPALMKRFHDAKEKGDSEVTMWGTGAAIREFIYVDDLAAALYFLMETYDDPQVINIGSHEEVSMKDLANKIQKVTGYTGKIVYDSTKPDGMRKRVLDSTRIQKLGFTPSTSLTDGLEKTYRSFLEQTS